MNAPAMQFLRSAEPTERCLIWPFQRNRKGYGRLKVAGKKVLAHRLCCIIHHGPPPAPDLHAAHRCGNPSCVNPGHLRWATAAENCADKHIHGTILRGSDNGRAKLSSRDVADIRRIGRRQSTRALARQYGVAPSTIGRIINRERWASPSASSVRVAEAGADTGPAQ